MGPVPTPAQRWGPGKTGPQTSVGPGLLADRTHVTFRLGSGHCGCATPAFPSMDLLPFPETNLFQRGLTTATIKTIHGLIPGEKGDDRG